MKISIIHPSRNRPQQAFETAKKWVGFADYKTEYILSLDIDDPELPEYKRLFGEDDEYYTLLIDDNRQSAIEAINWGAQKAKGDLLIVVSDDFSCPAHWDSQLISELSGKSDFVLKTKDGIQKTLVTLPIVDRIWYDRYGYVYEPGYYHMYADQDLTAVAIMTGKLLCSDLEFAHNHYTTGKTALDAVNQKNNATYPQGSAYFNQRLRNNFGISKPVCSYESIVWH